MSLVNFNSVARRLLPHFLRKSKGLAFVYSFMKPLQDVNGLFTAFVYSIKFKLAFNAQIIYLEQYLNTVYPNSFIYPSNIHIIDTANVDFIYIFNELESRDDTYFFNVGETYTQTYLNNQTELTSGNDYIVRVPTAVQSGQDWNGVDYNENILKKRVNFYNNAGKSYEIQYF